MAAFRNLLRLYPQDIFVHRRYQDWLSGNETVRQQEQQVADYRGAYEMDPNDLRHGYLYARILARRDYQKAFDILSGLAATHPDSPWPHLGLSQMRTIRQLQDLTDARRQLDLYLAACPSSLDPIALNLIQRVGDKALWQRTAERLRDQLTSRDDPAAIAAWPQLWTLESRIRPAAEQELSRRQIAEDLKMLRALDQTGLNDWYNVLRQGYQTINDAAGVQWTDSQLLRNLTSSSLAFDLLHRQWWAAHSTETGVPKGPAETRARKLLQASDEWTRRWASHPMAWYARMRAVETLKDTPAEVIEEVAAKVMLTSDRSPDAVRGTVPPALDIARLRLERGVAIHRVPELILQAEQWVIAKYEADRKIQYGVWGSPADLEAFRLEETWACRKVLFDFHWKTGQKENALEVLESMQQSVSALDPKGLPATGWPLVFDMALTLGRLDKARAALARMESRNDAYWQSAAALAEAEGRKLDAVAFYLNTKSVAAQEKALALWLSLGGTAAGWEATVGRTAVKPPADEAAAWQRLARDLPDFVLEDVAGRKVRLADLQGKTTFVNVWATWCGPCREELPQVQELYRALKDRKDVAIMTLNADENPAVVKPFLDRVGYTFPTLLASDYVFKTLEVNGIPRNWIVDKTGVIRLELATFDRVEMSKLVMAMLEKLKDQ